MPLYKLYWGGSPHSGEVDFGSLILKQSNSLLYKILFFSGFCIQSSSHTTLLSLSLTLLKNSKIWQNLNTQFYNCTGWLFFALAAALVHPQHGLVAQVRYDDEIQWTPLEVVKTVECETFLCGNSDLEIPLGFSNCCYIRDNLALMSL